VDTNLLREHIQKFLADARRDPNRIDRDLRERIELTTFYKQFSIERILAMSSEDVYEYLSGLWAMLIWGNKHYVVDKIIQDNGLDSLQRNLADLVWGSADVAQRWNRFRTEVKGMGPAMISEILCKTHPDDFMIWNRATKLALTYLKVQGLPRYDYQLTGEVYTHLCEVSKIIARELRQAGLEDTSLLAVDYFIWAELQIQETAVALQPAVSQVEPNGIDVSNFIHNDVRDKLRDIGQWLGFEAKIEQKVSEGSKVDTIWEATIGNMGRVIYVFEVQTKGSIDSLILNLLKSLNNPAVQGVVAVSDSKQLEKIKSHARDVSGLRDKLKYWDYEEILRVHEGLEFVNASINNLGLVPQGF